MFNVYVYYRVDVGHQIAAELPIRALMTRMACCAAGVSARLLKKRDEPLLWMESYVGIADAGHFLHELSAAASEFDVGVFINGERHVECFCGDPMR